MLCPVLGGNYRERSWRRLSFVSILLFEIDFSYSSVLQRRNIGFFRAQLPFSGRSRQRSRFQ
jgi:hypothetical protein